MALLAETLVEEWLNRRGFFTLRGLKEGLSEMDLLAVRHRPDAAPEGWHVEVQASFSPISHIAKLTDELAAKLGKSKNAAGARDLDDQDVCVADWVKKKFRDERKQRRREKLWPGADWKFVLVHGVVKYEQELGLIEKHGVELISLRHVLDELCPSGKPEFTASAGGDLAALIQYYAGDRRLAPATPEM